ncbi:MAG: 2-C-methyl-D-erythritol 2,4-cyclodiphosphate synthase [Gemmata sp.]
MTFRVGSGHDTHRLAEGRPLILGGVTVPHAKGLVGHSDADAVLHAVTDALLGAAGLGDIGDAYPDTDPRWQGADSRHFLTETLEHLNQLGWKPVNLDVTIFAQEPKLGPAKGAIKSSLARLTGLPADCINVKAKTGEKVGHIGRGEAIGAHAVVLIAKAVGP